MKLCNFVSTILILAKIVCTHINKKNSQSIQNKKVRNIIIHNYDENRIVNKITNNGKQGDLTYFEQYNCLQTL